MSESKQGERNDGSAVPTLLARSARALAWSYGLTLLKSGVSFGLGVALARQLGPKPFGLVAIALLMIAPGMILIEAGAGAALVQREKLSEEAVACAFTWQLSVGALLTGVLLLIAPVIGDVFRTPEVVPVLRVIAPAFLLQSIGLVSTALLRRELRHKSILLATTSSYLLGFGAIGLPLAVAGAGVWALVVAQLVQTSVSSVVLLALRPHRWRLQPPWNDRLLVRYSRQVLQVNALNWLIENGDNIVIGRLLGAPLLGVYSRGYATARLPTDLVTTSLQSVTFSTQSRQANDSASGRSLLAALNGVSLIALPGLTTLALLGKPIVLLLYGPAWSAAGPLLIPLSIAMCFHCLVAVTGPMLWARDKVRRETSAQLASLLVFAVALAVVHGSVTQVAWVVAGTYLARGLLMLRSAVRLAGLPFRPVARGCLAGARPALLAAGCAIAARSLFHQPAAVTAAGVGAAVIAAVACGLAARPMEWSPPLAEAAGRLHLPVIGARLGRSPLDEAKAAA